VRSHWNRGRKKDSVHVSVCPAGTTVEPKTNYKAAEDSDYSPECPRCGSVGPHAEEKIDVPLPFRTTTGGRTAIIGLFNGRCGRLVVHRAWYRLIITRRGRSANLEFQNHHLDRSHLSGLGTADTTTTSMSNSLSLLYVADPEIRPDPPSSPGRCGRTRCRVLPRLATFIPGSHLHALTRSRVLKATRCDITSAGVPHFLSGSSAEATV
jgi:hypothetical protein